MSLKKSVLASAVAAAVALPAAMTAQADGHKSSSFGGRVHVRLEADEDEDLNLADAGSRVFWKAQGEMDSGNMAGAHLEFEYKASDRNDYGSTTNIGADGDGTADNGTIVVRHANVSVAGGFGKVTLGRQNNPHNKVYKSDIFERNSGWFEAAPFRIGSGVVYSVNAGPVAIDVGVQMDGQSNDDGEDVDATVIAGSFSAGAVDVTISNYSLNEDGGAGADESITGVGASWTSGPLTLAGFFEDASEVEQTHVDVGVLYDLGGVALGADIATCENDDGTGCGGFDEETRTLVGAYFGLGAGASAYAEYGALDEADTNNLTFGYRVTW